MIITGPNDKVYPIVKVATILDLLVEEGVAVEQALAGTGLSAAALTSPAARVSLLQVAECYRNAIRLSPDPWFAWHAGLRFHVSSYGMYGFAMLSSTNFRQTMRFAVAYHALATPLAEVTFREEHDRGIWTFVPLAHPMVDAALYRHIVELQCGIMTSLQKDIMGSGFAAREIHLEYPAPPGRPDYAGVFGCPVLFSQPSNALVFDAVWLDHPAALGNRITYKTVVKLCDGLLGELELRAGVAGKVRQALLVRLPKPTRFADIAAELGMSARTLRRRLAEEGAAYHALVDALRAEMAIKYLRETDLKVGEIAAALGFSEVGNFRHAFHRWAGASPNKFRDVRRPDPPSAH